jgi:hypothetical protein
MGRTIQEENKAPVQEAVDTLSNGRDYAAAESATGVEHQRYLPL